MVTTQDVGERRGEDARICMIVTYAP
jgi:hypothetical protein